MDSNKNPQIPSSQIPKKVEKGVVAPLEDSPQLLQVASGSTPSSVAGAIAGMIREKGFCELQAIGAGAVNQSVKAIAIARGYMAPSGIDLVCIPAFVDVKISGEDRTAIKFVIEPRHQRTH